MNRERIRRMSERAFYHRALDVDNFVGKEIIGEISVYKTEESYEKMLRRVLPILPLNIVFVLLRKNMDFLHVFLEYFDNHASNLETAKYLSFLCHVFDYIPIQWIERHVYKIKDARVAHRFLYYVFSHPISYCAYPYKILAENEIVWAKYALLVQINPEYSPFISWNKLLDIRTSLREIIEFKIDISLENFLKSDKEDFILHVVRSAANSSQLGANIQNNILPYCEENNLDSGKIIARGIATKSWSVDQKLQVLSEYVVSNSSKKASLEIMTFKDDAELDQIREYAKQYGIQYEPDPELYSQCISNSNPISRTHSVLCLSGAPKANSPPESPKKMWRRSPSIDLSMQSFLNNPSTISSLADGEPKDPVEYANKLRKYRNLKEIRPVYELANHFGIVVSYSEISDVIGKQQAFNSIMDQVGWAEFGSICELFNLSSEEIMNFMSSSSIPNQEIFQIIPVLHQYVNAYNCEQFLDHLSRFIFGAKKDLSIDIQKLLVLWYDTLEKFFPYAPLEGVQEYLDQIEVIYFLINSNDVDLIKRTLDQFEHGVQTIDILSKFLIKGDVDLHVPKLSSNFVLIDFIQNIRIIDQIHQNDDVDELEKAIERVSGTLYITLYILYDKLVQKGRDFRFQMRILSILQTAPKHCIDFHSLFKNPMQTLKDSISTDNICSLLEILSEFLLSKDELLLHLIQNRMQSKQLDDYRSIIMKLDNPNNDVIQKVLVSRLPLDEIIELFSTLGNTNVMNQNQTIKELTIYGLKKFVNDIIMNSPEVLINNLYDDEATRTRLGNRLHVLARKIALRYDLTIENVTSSMVEAWLNESYPRSSLFDFDKSIFDVTPEEEMEAKDLSIVEKCLFLFQAWDRHLVVEKLVCLEKSSVSIHAKANALLCLFCFEDEHTLTKKYSLDMNMYKNRYYKLHFLNFAGLAGLSIDSESQIDQDLTMNLLSLPKSPFRDSLLVLAHFDNPSRTGIDIVELVHELSTTRVRFLIKYFHKLFLNSRNEKIYDSFLNIVSAPFHELIKMSKEIRVLTPKHWDFFYDTFIIISKVHIDFDKLKFDNEYISIDKVVTNLCQNNYGALVADLAVHIPKGNIRKRVCEILASSKYFDESIKVSLDCAEMFVYIIIQGYLKDAVCVLKDDNIVKLTNWLYENKKNEEIDIVKDALSSSGRTKEINRMMERFSRL